MNDAVPTNALGPDRDLSAGLAVEEVADRVFVLTDGDAQALFVDTGDGVVVVDTPWAQEQHAAIRRVTSAPITHLIYSHSHYDHIGGAHELAAKEVVGQTCTADLLRRYADPRRPAPTITFDQDLVLDRGEHRIELHYHGPNHQDGDIFVHLPRQHVLMLVDVIVPGWVPFHALGGATDVRGYLDAHDTTLDYDFEILVAGHLTRFGTAEDVRTQRDYITDVKDTCTRARETVSAASIASRTGTADRWQFASTYFNELARQAAAEVEPRWRDRLGGVEAFTHSHCLSMTIALAHGWGIEPAT